MRKLTETEREKIIEYIDSGEQWPLYYKDSAFPTPR